MEHPTQKENITQDKTGRRVTFDFITKSLGLPQGPRICLLDLCAEDTLWGNTFDRSVLIEDAVLVWLCRKGSCTAMVGGRNHTLEEGQLLLVFSNTFCRFSSSSHDFEASTLVGCINPRATYNSIASNYPQIVATPVLTLSESELKTLLSLFDYAKNSLHNPHNSRREELDLGILRVLHDELSDMLLRHNFEAQEQTPNERIVEEFRSMLATSTFEHRDVEYYASQFNLTPKRFAAIVKKVTGETPLSMIAGALIVAAQRMLACTELTSSEIAERLYFATPSFFCRYFRRYTGQTPTEWRNTHAQP